MDYGKEFRKYATKHHGLSSIYVDDYLQKSITNLTPNIIEERPMNVAALDVFSRLMMDRIIFMGTGIDDYVAKRHYGTVAIFRICRQQRDIQIYVNSPGGSVYAGLGIYDTMQYVNQMWQLAVLVLLHLWLQYYYVLVKKTNVVH
jgi:ATP-dependent Clp protease protease subunit